MSSSISSLNGGRYAPSIATFKEEFDDEVRDCEVLIYLSVLEDTPIVKYLDWDSLKHWALAFRYGNRTILFQLVNPTGELVGGLIKPSWEDSKRGHNNHSTTSSCFSKEVSLGKIKTSPRKVYNSAKNHPMNGTIYHAKNNNCQEWVMTLLAMFDKKLLLKMEQKGIKPIKDDGMLLPRSVGSKIQESSQKGQIIYFIDGKSPLRPKEIFSN